MKISSIKPYKVEHGVPLRIQVTVVSEVFVWVKGKRIGRKVSFTRHLRLENNGQYVGNGIHTKFKSYGSMSDLTKAYKAYHNDQNSQEAA